MPGSSSITVAATLSSRASMASQAVASASTNTSASASTSTKTTPTKAPTATSVNNNTTIASSSTPGAVPAKSAAQNLIELDPLDSPDFDPIAFLNREFPTGMSIKYLYFEIKSQKHSVFTVIMFYFIHVHL